jgi:hypothetical protein
MFLVRDLGVSITKSCWEGLLAWRVRGRQGYLLIGWDERGMTYLQKVDRTQSAPIKYSRVKSCLMEPNGHG